MHSDEPMHPVNPTYPDGETATVPYVEEHLYRQVQSLDDATTPTFSSQLLDDYAQQVISVLKEMQSHMYCTQCHTPKPFKLTSYSKKSDATALKFLSHFLRGSSTIFGLARVAYVCDSIFEWSHFAAQRQSRSWTGPFVAFMEGLLDDLRRETSSGIQRVKPL